jgi:hypothetical protein
MPTALATFALLATGVGADDERIANALDWLVGQPTVHTAGLAWRARAFALAGRTRRKYLTFLGRDVAQLLASTKDGYWGGESRGKPPGYRPRRYDIRPSYQGMLGVVAASRAGLDVPGGFWTAAMDFWTKAQRKDGAWPSSYGRADASRTAAGVFCVLAITERLRSEGAPAAILLRGGDGELPRSSQAGVAWLDKHFVTYIKGARVRAYGPSYGYLHALSEGARAAGRKLIGGLDWLEGSLPALTEHRREGGCWEDAGGSELPTARMVLFFVNAARCGGEAEAAGRAR